MTAWIDVFAGAGGFTTGAERAGATVVAAVNHWDLALATHAANHPHIEHYNDNALTFDFARLPRHRFGHLSPECTYYAVRARGGKPGPRRDESRATALCTHRYVKACEPEAVTVENVEEYAASPEASRVVRRVRALGYGHRRFFLDSVHFEVPQSRLRVFDVFLRGRRVPRWQPPVLPAEAWMPVAAVLDPSVPWNPTEPAARRARGLAPLAEGTLRQIDAGKTRFGGATFLVPYYGAWRREDYVLVYPITQPVGTLETVDRYGLCRHHEGAWQFRMMTPGEQSRCFGFPVGYKLLGNRRDQVRQVGNAVVCNVAAWLVSRVMEECS